MTCCCKTVIGVYCQQFVLQRDWIGQTVSFLSKHIMLSSRPNFDDVRERQQQRITGSPVGGWQGECQATPSHVPGGHHKKCGNIITEGVLITTQSVAGPLSIKFIWTSMEIYRVMIYVQWRPFILNGWCVDVVHRGHTAQHSAGVGVVSGVWQAVDHPPLHLIFVWNQLRQNHVSFAVQREGTPSFRVVLIILINCRKGRMPLSARHVLCWPWFCRSNSGWCVPCSCACYQKE